MSVKQMLNYITEMGMTELLNEPIICGYRDPRDMAAVLLYYQIWKYVNSMSVGSK